MDAVMELQREIELALTDEQEICDGSALPMRPRTSTKMTDYFKNARVTNTWPAHTPRARKLARRHPGLVKVRRYQDDSGEIKKTIELDLEAIMKEEVVMDKNVKRQSVVSSVRPFVSEQAVRSIKEDLKDQNWYAVGDGRHSVSSDGQTVEIVQNADDVNVFNVKVTRYH